MNLPPPRISDLERAPNERVASVLRSAIPGEVVADHHRQWESGKTQQQQQEQEQSSSSSSSVSQESSSSTIRNSAVSTAAQTNEEEDDEEEDQSERWFVVRESTAGAAPAAEEDENINAVTLKGEIEGKNVTITLDTRKQSNNMEAELDVQEDSCFTNDAWMKQLGDKFRLELKSSKLKE